MSRGLNTSVDETICQSCGAERRGEFCEECGERRFDRHDLSLAHVIEHGIEGFTHFDYKVPRTLWTLLISPGTVEAEVLKGRRTLWAKPFALFVIVNLLFYFGASLINFTGFSTPAAVHTALSPYRQLAARLFAWQAEAKGLSPETYIANFDALVPSVAKTMPFLFALTLALWLALLLWRKRRYVLEHFYVALLWTTRMLILVLVINVIFGLAVTYASIPLPWSYDATSSLVLGLILAWTWYGTLRRVYAVGPIAAAPAALLSTAAFMAILIFVYRPVLMLITMALL